MGFLSHRKPTPENPLQVRQVVQQCFDVALAQFDRYAQERQHILDEESALASTAHEFIQSLLRLYHKSAQGVTSSLEKITKSFAELATSLRQPMEDSPQRPQTPPLVPVAANQSDRSFMIGLARELWLAWRDAPTNEARFSLERVMGNIGMDPIGEVGQRVNYDGLRQQAIDPVDPALEVEITRLGWELREPDNSTLLIGKATVRSVGSHVTTANLKESEEEHASSTEY